MKVLQINSVCYASTGRLAVGLAKAVSDSGGQSLVAYGRGAPSDKVACQKICSSASVHAHALFSRLVDRSGFFGASNRLVGLSKEFDPDIIHLHNIHGYYLNVRTLFKFLRERAKPVIWTLHDCWALTGHCAYFEHNCAKWQTGCNACPQKNKYPKRLFLDSSVKNYAQKKQLFCGVEDLTLVCPSDWLAGIVRQSYLKDKDVRVIKNGIDTQAFRRSENDVRGEYGLDTRPLVLGVASVWEERKGLEDFYELGEILGENFQIFLVGLTDRQIQKLPPKIKGINRTKNIAQLAQIYASADVFFNPTYEDNYPTVNLEALVGGTPVVTYDTGGSPEPINGLNGACVERGNIRMAAQKIVQISANLTAQLRQKISQDAQARFDIKLYERDMLQLYSDKLKQC